MSTAKNGEQAPIQLSEEPANAQKAELTVSRSTANEHEPVNDASKNTSIANAATSFQVAKALAKSRAQVDAIEPEVHSSPDKFVRAASDGNGTAAVALFKYLANGKTIPELHDTNQRLVSFEWLEMAANRGDVLAMFTYGTQASTYIRYATDLSSEQKTAIENKARGYIFSLISNGATEAFPWAASHYFNGELGRTDISMASALLTRFQELGGSEATVSDFRANVSRLLTKAQSDEAEVLLGVLRSNPRDSRLAARI